MIGRCAHLLGTRCALKMRTLGYSSRYLSLECECPFKEGQWACCKEYKEITLEQRVEELEKAIESMCKWIKPPVMKTGGVVNSANCISVNDTHSHWWKS